MIDFDIRLLLEAIMPLSHLRQHALEAKAEEHVSDENLSSRLVDLHEHFAHCGLTVTADFALDLANSIMVKSNVKAIARQIDIFNQVLIREFSAKAIMMLPSERAQYNRTPQEIFGQAVCIAFPSAMDDLEEAAKCLAFGRATAGVFHLMRVVEAGMKSLAAALDIPYAPSWESYIKQIGGKIAAEHKSKTIDWKRDEPYFRDLLGDLQAIKMAWRNPTMHIVRRYTTDEAEDVLVAVRALMWRLAVRFSEKSPRKRRGAGGKARGIT
jgi:hypothetical protein